jgi:hypothetical protein
MKLSKLPDRTPVKLTMSMTPNLAARLRDYAAFYAETYGNREEVADLIPFMLEAFLDGDTDFRRAGRVGRESSGVAQRNVSDQRHRKGPEPEQGGSLILPKGE